MPSDLDDVLAQTAAWRAAGHDVALATVTRTWGSSPRPAGSQLVVNAAGEFRGSVSGGCIEAAVVQAAQSVLAEKRPRLLHFGVTNEMAWEVGLACGGQVDVWVAPADPAIVDELARARRDKASVVLATSLESGEQTILRADDPDARRPLARDAAEVIDSPRGQLFLHPVNPPLRLFVVGAVHVAQPLVRLAAIAGMDVTVIDPRAAFTIDASRVTEWPDTALARLAPDARSAVVTLTHDPKLDDPALLAALSTPAFYVGCLGSRKTHAARLERLAQAGVSAENLARLHGPVGLDIGARTPAEIAVSILAHIVQILRKETV